MPMADILKAACLVAPTLGSAACGPGFSIARRPVGGVSLHICGFAVERREGGADLVRAHSSVNHALTAAPHQSSVWLLLAGLASRYRLPSIDVKEAIRMSYYTGPSELDLMPLRLWIAVHSDAFSDIDLRDSISREVRLLFTHQQKSAIAAAYNAAPSVGRQLIEQTIREFDPAAAESLRARGQGSHSPD
jgi:hypothetical protein